MEHFECKAILLPMLISMTWTKYVIVVYDRTLWRYIYAVIEMKTKISRHFIYDWILVG